ncbi:MAG: ATP-binding protein [Blastochloris sp.]|nr:ATP-binding protein [Blastochloris sp.]
MHPETRPTRPQLIVISGHAGSGKTSLATALAAELHLPLLSKDVIKEALFDSLGWHDRAWSQLLGVAAITVLFRQLEVFVANGHGCMVESIFRRDLDSPRFRDYGARYGLQLIAIQCVAPGAILVDRVRARVAVGVRHPGHVDHAWQRNRQRCSMLRHGRRWISAGRC